MQNVMVCLIILVWSLIHCFHPCSEHLSDQPVFERPPAKYSAERILQILLNPTLQKDKICNLKPVNVHSSATYVVDVRNLKSMEDIKKDEFGIWNYSGSHPQMYRVSIQDKGSLSVDKCSSGTKGPDVVCLRRLHCTHLSNPKFKRLISFVSGTLTECMCAYIEYLVIQQSCSIDRKLWKVGGIESASY